MLLTFSAIFNHTEVIIPQESIFLSSKTGSVICIIVNFEPSIIVKYMLRITTIHAQNGE